MRLDHTYSGNCLELAKQLDDDSIQACITSPPYFGQRHYEVPYSLWGGSGDCQHEWQIAAKAPTAYSVVNRDAAPTYDCKICGGWIGDLGNESDPLAYINHLVEVFTGIKLALRDDGVLWIVVGDIYCSKRNGQYKPKDLIPTAFLLANALQADGWWWRSTVIWDKPNARPESYTDRPTLSHEYVIMLTKSARYYYNIDGTREPYTEPLNRWGGMSIKKQTAMHSKYLESHNMGSSSIMRAGRRIRPNPRGRQKRSVWRQKTVTYYGLHFAPFPVALVEPMILASTRPGDTVLDPFMGSGSTGKAAKILARHWIGFEANPQYTDMANERAGEPEQQTLFARSEWGRAKAGAIPAGAPKKEE